MYIYMGMCTDWPHASVYNVHIGSFAGYTSQIGVEPTRQRKQNGDAPTRTTRAMHARHGSRSRLLL